MLITEEDLYKPIDLITENPQLAIFAAIDYLQQISAAMTGIYIRLGELTEQVRKYRPRGLDTSPDGLE